MDALAALPAEKRDRILNAAFTQFAKNGYRKTSMADVATAAGVSKASLFHYFGSKQEMYLFLYNMGVDVILTAVFTGLRGLSADFFERMGQVGAVKLETVARYAGMYDFLDAAIAEEAPEVREGMRGSNQTYFQKGFEALFDGIDWSKFKPGVDRRAVTELVTWVGEGMAKKMAGKKIAPADISRESDVYLGLIKSAVYKEEYL